MRVFEGGDTPSPVTLSRRIRDRRVDGRRWACLQTSAGSSTYVNTGHSFFKVLMYSQSGSMRPALSCFPAPPLPWHCSGRRLRHRGPARGPLRATSSQRPVHPGHSVPCWLVLPFVAFSLKRGRWGVCGLPVGPAGGAPEPQVTVPAAWPVSRGPGEEGFVESLGGVTLVGGTDAEAGKWDWGRWGRPGAWTARCLSACWQPSLL